MEKGADTSAPFFVILTYERLQPVRDDPLIQFLATKPSPHASNCVAKGYSAASGIARPISVSWATTVAMICWKVAKSARGVIVRSSM